MCISFIDTSNHSDRRAYSPRTRYVNTISHKNFSENIRTSLHNVILKADNRPVHQQNHQGHQNDVPGYRVAQRASSTVIY